MKMPHYDVVFSLLAFIVKQHTISGTDFSKTDEGKVQVWAFPPMSVSPPD